MLVSKFSEYILLHYFLRNMAAMMSQATEKVRVVNYGLADTLLKKSVVDLVFSYFDISQSVKIWKTKNPLSAHPQDVFFDGNTKEHLMDSSAEHLTDAFDGCLASSSAEHSASFSASSLGEYLPASAVVLNGLTPENVLQHQHDYDKILKIVNQVLPFVHFGQRTKTLFGTGLFRYSSRDHDGTIHHSIFTCNAVGDIKRLRQCVAQSYKLVFSEIISDYDELSYDHYAQCDGSNERCRNKYFDWLELKHTHTCYECCQIREEAKRKAIILKKAILAGKTIPLKKFDCSSPGTIEFEDVFGMSLGVSDVYYDNELNSLSQVTQEEMDNFEYDGREIEVDPKLVELALAQMNA
jgi:hypothetical protein